MSIDDPAHLNKAISAIGNFPRELFDIESE